MLHDRTTKGDHLLLVCRHTPRPDGDKAQRRNWRLLKIASRTHRVHLATLLDGRLCLTEWRGLARRTEKLAIIPRGFTSAARRLRRQLRDWATGHRFHVVVCDDPTLWPALNALPADVRLCAHDTQGTLIARRLPPDVVTVPHHAAPDRLARLLPARREPASAPHPFPEVVVTPPVLRRAA